MIKHIKRMDNNCHIPDLFQEFSNVENGRFFQFTFLFLFFINKKCSL